MCLTYTPAFANILPHTYTCLYCISPNTLTRWDRLVFTRCYSSFVIFSLSLWHIYTNTHTQTTHQAVWCPVILGQVCIFWVQRVKFTQRSDMIEDVWLLCLIPVVGVKLDVSAWMASFINTTQRINVSTWYLCDTCMCEDTHSVQDVTCNFSICSAVFPVQWWDLWL